MKPPVFEYVAPRSSQETLSLLTQYGEDARLLAGGQSLIPLLNFRLARPSVLIDINRCPDFNYLHLEAGSIVIGPMTRQAAAEHSAIVREHCPLLVHALRFMGHLTIRNRGTVGGSLAHGDSGAELPTAAMVLNAELILEREDGRRSLSPDEFFLDSLVTAIEPGEMLREIRFPIKQAGDRYTFTESGVRRADLAIAGVAAHVHIGDSGLCEKASLVALGGGTRPTRLTSVEAAVVGAKIGDIDICAAAAAGRADVDPPTDLQATAGYRRDLLVSLTVDALKQVFDVEVK
jgi:CO/xanthine dehydrogenase FAD-binding subunit